MKNPGWSRIGIRCARLLFLALVPGCGVSCPYGEFGGGCGGEAARYSQTEIPPIILIHGIKGGKLVRADGSNKTVWGYTGLNVFFHTFDDLALYPPTRPTAEPWNDELYYQAVDPLKTIRPEKVLTGFTVGWEWLPLFEYELYGHLVDVLTKRPLELRQDETLFLFAYDWRLDNRLSAIRLAKSLPSYEEKFLNFQARIALGTGTSDKPPATPSSFKQCVAEIKKPGEKPTSPCQKRGVRLRDTGALDGVGHVRFSIVSHSMGGLVSRYFVEGLGYSGRVHKLIFFGAPHLGGIDALRGVLEGEGPPSLSHYFGLKFFGKGATRRVHLSFGSVFQLLPRYADAVVNLNPETGLAVDVREEFGLRRGTITPAVVQRWTVLLVPLGEELRTHYPGPRGLERYLEFQLESARCFHLAISAQTPEIIDQLKACGEENRVRQIVNYLKKYDQQDQPLPEKDLSRAPPILDLGGYCYETTTALVVIGDIEEKIEFTASLKVPRQLAAAAWVLGPGDNRVPVKTLYYPPAVRKGNATFAVCKDHVGIIKDKELHYNLLRAMFDTVLPPID